MTKRARWAVPVGTGAVIAALIGGSSLIASAAPGLPELTAEELVTKIAEAEPVALSGTAVYTARLGLPELPMEAHGAAGPLSLLSGSSTIRLWSDGSEHSRAAITGAMSEYSFIRSGAEAWTYSSQDNTAVHYAVPPQDLARYEELRTSGGRVPAGSQVPTPAEIADEILGHGQETSTFSVDSATRVAGRDAYQLGVVPTDSGTLVDRVLLAVDAKTFVPLRVQVWGAGDHRDPAIEVAFTDISFTAPDPSTFDFVPPATATVETVTVPLPADTTATDSSSEPAPDVLGEGWGTVIALRANTGTATGSEPGAEPSGSVATPAPGEASDELLGEFDSSTATPPGGLSMDTDAVLNSLVTDVDGGRAITSRLVSVLFTDDGRVLIGAVPLDTLLALAT